MKVADLVEEDGAVVGRLELADLELVSALKGTSLVPEQLALQELPRHGRAVDLDEWPRPSGGEMVDRPCDELLTGACLARHKNRDVDAGRFAKDLARLQHLGAAPELHLPSDPPCHLLGSRSERLGLRANQLVDGLLELVEVQWLVEHRLHLERGGVAGAVAAGPHGRDLARISALDLQTTNQLFGVGAAVR